MVTALAWCGDRSGSQPQGQVSPALRHDRARADDGTGLMAGGGFNGGEAMVLTTDLHWTDAEATLHREGSLDL